MILLSKTLIVFKLFIVGIFLFLPMYAFAQEFSFIKSQEIIDGLSGAVFTATADFNKDGNLDLAVANENLNSVSILLGTGHGLFSAPTNFFAGLGIFSLTIADFNEDGNLDLATASGSGISILLGNGDGSFTHSKDIFLLSSFRPGRGVSPISISKGDFNNDGHIDLVVSNDSERSVAVLYGDGRGNFSAPIFLLASSSSSAEVNIGGIRAVAVGDFNEDGHLDIAAASFDESKVFIFFGDNQGNFSTSINFAAGVNPRSLSVADVNKDGHFDLVIGGSFNGNLATFLGNGEGNFNNPIYSNNIGFVDRSFAIADFNQDGNLDIAVPNLRTNNVDIGSGNGNGFFTFVASFPSGGRGATSGDFNNDGLPDLAVSMGRIIIFINNSPIKINIDIKPSSFPNCINLKSKGFVSVAILGNNNFDVKTVNPATIKFTGIPIALKENGKFSVSSEDVNNDNIADLVLHFDTTQLLLTGNETSTTLTGNLFSGRGIKGSDSICFAKGSFR